MTDKKTTRTPRNAETITKGALSLTFQEQVELLRTLEKNIQAELTRLQEQAESAAKLVNTK